METIRVDEIGAGACADGVDFDSLGLLREARHAMLRDNLRQMGILGPNMVQAHSAPLLLAGRDLLLHASTGSGKTLAFLLPALSRALDEAGGVQVLILCPSKELAMQTHRSCRALLEGTSLTSLPLVGGVNVARQEDALRKTRPQIIVATPRRLVEVALGGERRLFKLGAVRTIIVDEADEVLRPPHAADLEQILWHTQRAAADARAYATSAAAASAVQLVFASATGDSPAVQAAAARLMRDPALLAVHRASDAKGLPPTIAHGLVVVPSHKRIEALRKILSIEPRPQLLAFVNTPAEADYVTDKLVELGVPDVMAVRSSQERDERVTAMQRLLSGKLRAIVCTDLAARGLDVPSLSLVVNMDVPDDGRRYVHRAGRCGRAGREGAVISIVSTAAQALAVRALAAKLSVRLRDVEVKGGTLNWDVPPADGVLTDEAPPPPSSRLPAAAPARRPPRPASADADGGDGAAPSRRPPRPASANGGDGAAFARRQPRPTSADGFESAPPAEREWTRLKPRRETAPELAAAAKARARAAKAGTGRGDATAQKPSQRGVDRRGTAAAAESGWTKVSTAPASRSNGDAAPQRPRSSPGGPPSPRPARRPE
jgi:superfamily II DNA/RNA helicase